MRTSCTAVFLMKTDKQQNSFWEIILNWATRNNLFVSSFLASRSQYFFFLRRAKPLFLLFYLFAYFSFHTDLHWTLKIGHVCVVALKNTSLMSIQTQTSRRNHCITLHFEEINANKCSFVLLRLRRAEQILNRSSKNTWIPCYRNSRRGFLLPQQS